MKKKAALLVMMALVVSLAPLSAQKIKTPSYPTLRIDVPELVSVGDEVTVEITVSYPNSDANNHIMYVLLYENYKKVMVWRWDEENEFNEDEFTLTYTTVLTEDTAFFVYSKSTIHGSSGTTAYVEVVS